MGLLVLGTALSWEETKKLVDLLRQSGAEQFIRMFTTHRDLQSTQLVWGDEVSVGNVSCSLDPI